MAEAPSSMPWAASILSHVGAVSLSYEICHQSSPVLSQYMYRTNMIWATSAAESLLSEQYRVTGAILEVWFSLNRGYSKGNGLLVMKFPYIIIWNPWLSYGTVHLSNRDFNTKRDHIQFQVLEAKGMLQNMRFPSLMVWKL